MPLLIKIIVGFVGMFAAVMVGDAHRQPDLLYLSALTFGVGLGLLPNRWFWRS